MVVLHPVTAECAWAAGFFTAKGSVRADLTKRPRGGLPNCYVTLEISASSEAGMAECVERFAKAIGVGKVAYRTINEHHLVIWRTSAVKDMQTVRTKLWPYLGDRLRAHWDHSIEQVAAARTPKGAGGKRAPSHERS